MPANIALLGSGVFAKASYLPAILSLHGDVLNLHSIWSRSSSSVESFLSEIKKESSNSNLTSNSKELKPELKFGENGLNEILLNKEIDGVLIVLPISSQAEIIKKCWKSNKHVLSEKPIAKDLKIAKNLIEEYEKEYKPKGIIWRVAENYAHEPILREAGKIISNTPELGPILFWQLNFQGYIEDGSKYQSTTWRTIPDYQGGFLLDGGVHWIALLRTVLPLGALPNSIISIKSLHRTHLLPYDTIQSISLPLKSSITNSHGPKTKVKTAEFNEKDIIGEIGKSFPTGQILMSFAISELPNELNSKSQINGLKIHFLNGLIEITCEFNEITKQREFIFELIPSIGSSSKNLKNNKINGPMNGVEIEIKMFCNAINDFKNEKSILEEDDFGKPRDALYDLSVIQAMLESDGKELKIDNSIDN
ncbi:uncharacterized protein I206_105574 [Kwoniella pini CBS 10737]|uniref:Gfo/Idh/MocA-like oxidoreductase N-terminal domain-containing protein n=1 Tax=Kwoniella pini CBS 10737 TaxID=1296096 RepID=A0A1B9I3V7_9TREE|nr:uncharacterized protein I206_03523 [Kwoniella pini CBS 10737]OCF50204.1 hypothetical protein I206_03523 [Kwoniella pini CBS 10737]